MIDLKYTIDVKNLNIHVEDSYLVNSKKKIDEALLYIMQDPKYQELVDAGFTRCKGSMKTEWAAHNLLYRWHVSVNRTKDVDLDQKENPIRKLIYSILCAFYW